ncbi:MAG: PIG-L family deacetylase [Acidimicrobiales bacterium]
MTVVFVHAHPDDEAIFTGGTMAALARGGERVVLVLATGGEAGGEVARRAEETDRAVELLGVHRVVRLGHHDSGMDGDAANDHPDAFWRRDVDDTAAIVADVCREEKADALVTYDDHGIYGHLDHVQCHLVGIRAAELAGVGCIYEATVDREALHFVETHLVEEAALSAGPVVHDLGLAASRIGLPTVEITTVVDVRDVLDIKRAAMAAHASQIPETGSAMALGTAAFAGVYGFEWYRRRSPRDGPLDRLGLL